MRKLRVPVLIDRDLYDVFKDYSQMMGVPASKLIREAMAAFQPELERRLELLTRREQ